MRVACFLFGRSVFARRITVSADELFNFQERMNLVFYIHEDLDYFLNSLLKVKGKLCNYVTENLTLCSDE